MSADLGLDQDQMRALSDLIGSAQDFTEPLQGFDGRSAEENTNQGGDHRAPRAVIQLVAGQLPLVLDLAEAQLIAANHGLFQRGGLVVQIVTAPVRVSSDEERQAPRIVAVDANTVVDFMTQSARFQRQVRGAWVDTDFPKKFADIYLSRAGRWRLPVLEGLISAPTLRRDGSILDRQGYDRETGFFFSAQGTAFPDIPSAPTRDEAREALNVLLELIDTFPFADSASGSVALSAVLTALVRRSLRTAPLHALSAPVAGSGKSMIADIASTIATGRPVAVLSQGNREEELEKRLGAALLAGLEIMSIDNCEAPLGGVLLCQMLTQQSVSVRVLGLSKLVEVPTNTMVFATGNNLALAGDMTRRVIRATLDPQVERPEVRRFESNPLVEIALNRGRYVVAGLTVLRAFHVAGRPAQTEELGSYEEWSSLVRGALVWLGQADPCDSMNEVRDADPVLEALTAVMEQWCPNLRDRRVTARALINSADYLRTPWRDALMAIAGEGESINPRRLGNWLLANSGRIVGGRKIVRDGKQGGVVVWRLVER